MKTACIIAEYHPFHNGHAAMVQQLHREGYAVVAVMSGNFVQRGTPALLPKRVRTAAALAGGVDIVLELPCRAAAASAPRFAAAGVAAAVAAGAEILVFGAEDADLTLLQKISALLRSPDFSAAIQAPLRQGLSFAAARSKAVEQLMPEAVSLLQKPNNILAIAYLNALHDLQDAPDRNKPSRTLPRPVAYPRAGAAHDGSPQQGIASAGWLRAQPVEAWQPYVPTAAYRIYRQAQQNGWILSNERWQQTALTLLRCRTQKQLATLPDVTEGLDALLFRACRSAASLEEIYFVVKSKRYAHARIRRAVLAAVLGWWPEEAAEQENPCTADWGVPYLRILGAGEAGRSLLGELTRQSPVPVSPSLLRLQQCNARCAAAARQEVAAGDLYALCLEKPLPCGEEYRLPLLRTPCAE